MMNELVAFLSARLDEDQAWAEGCQGHHWVWERTEDDAVAEPNPVEEESLAGGDTVALRSVEEYESPYGTLSVTTPISHAEEVMSAAAGHIRRHDPARVLREVAGKRRIIDREVEKARGQRRQRVDEHRLTFDEWAGHFRWETLGLLASAYADHPDFQPHWRQR